MSVNHITWSIEKGDGLCPVCGEKTVLVIAGNTWDVDSEPYGDEDDKNVVGDRFIDGVEVGDDAEVTGHWCPTCNKLCSLSLNTRS